MCKCRFLQLRKTHVTALSKNPKARPRHERVDHTLFCRKKEETYIDVRKERVVNQFVFPFGSEMTELKALTGEYMT